MTPTKEKIKVADLIITAFEGGSNYWLRKAQLVDSTNQPVERPWYADEALYEADFNIRLEEHGDYDALYLTRNRLIRGQKILKTEFPWVWERLVDESYDAEDADTFLQFCLFGELVYG